MVARGGESAKDFIDSVSRVRPIQHVGARARESKMKITFRRVTLGLALALCGLLIGCADEPLKLDRGASAGAARKPPEIRFAGRVRLLGDLAQERGGAIFVSLRMADGPPLPFLTRQYTMDAPQIIREGDLTVLEFELDQSHSMSGMPLAELPSELEIKVAYSSDGFVEGLRGGPRVVVPAELGARDIAAELGPDSGAAPSSRPASRPTSQPAR